MSTTETPLHELFGALLDGRQQSTLRNALCVAAERFDENARKCRYWGCGEEARSIGDEFELQANETRQLIELLCDGPEEDEDEPCPINRRPQSTCPDGCDHGQSQVIEYPREAARGQRYTYWEVSAGVFNVRADASGGYARIEELAKLKGDTLERMERSK